MMKRFKRFWRAFWAFYNGHAPILEQEWDVDEIQALRNFMKTRVGQKLKSSLILQSYEQDRLATLEKEPVWMCGVATGFRLAILKIDEFTVVPAETEDEYETLAGLPAPNRFDQNNR
jgi:hypothetical protein